MKRVLVTAVICTFVLMQFATLQAQTQAVGLITGTAAGPAGPLAGVTVNVVNAAGQVVGSAVTTSTGAFSVGGLTAGTFSVNVVSAGGAVLSTSSATLTAAAMTTTVTASVSAATLAGAAGAAAAAGVGTAAAAGVSTAAVVGGVAAAAAAVGAAAVVSHKNPASATQ